MKVRNNYNRCLTNFACSIRKYFGLDYSHKTLDIVDEILERYKPKNVVTILLDGLGTNILEEITYAKDLFLVDSIKSSITTVFPATTVAATTSVMTGLNPVETGMLGWDMYLKGIDKTITTFLHCEKGDDSETPLPEAREYLKKHMKTKTIMQEIEEKGEYKAFSVIPFGDFPYSTTDEMFNDIETLCKLEGKKYIYAYNMEPDKTMHQLGCRSSRVLEIIKEFDKRIERLSRKLQDTVIFVIADHGHLNVQNIFLEEYPEILQCLRRTTSIEPRAVNFFIKEDKKDIFEDLFNKFFGDDFDLYKMEEVIASHLFGDGEENEVFRDLLGDYLAIGKTNKTLLCGGNNVLRSQHAGITDDEIYVPLIAIETRK